MAWGPRAPDVFIFGSFAAASSSSSLAIRPFQASHFSRSRPSTRSWMGRFQLTSSCPGACHGCVGCGREVAAATNSTAAHTPTGPTPLWPNPTSHLTTCALTARWYIVEETLAWLLFRGELCARVFSGGFPLPLLPSLNISRRK